jgi:phosphoribosylamine--glycine ligase
MNILLLGSGGRESALAYSIRKSTLCKNLYIAPGNGGTIEYGENIQLSPLHFDAIKDYCLKLGIDILVIGPEEPLVQGIADFFLSDEQLKRIIVVGPNMQAAQLEGSKSFSKTFMKKHGIPTADYLSFDAKTITDAKKYLASLKPPYVIKADGLAAGKGVFICSDFYEACNAIDDMIERNAFGAAGQTIVIEEFLDGIESSAFILCDGVNYIILPEAKDYKRIGENDTGLNTGGMGTVSPVPFIDDTFREKIRKKIIEPTINGLIEEGISYKGFLFIGLMNVKGEPYVIEYNVRLGDPETQVILPRIENDIVALFASFEDQSLDTHQLKVSTNVLVNVVLAIEGYPGAYKKNIPITITNVPEQTLLFHAGTTVDSEGQLRSSGGRVLSACGIGQTIEEAIQQAYSLVEQIEFEGKYVRYDIGKDVLKYCK